MSLVWRRLPETPEKEKIWVVFKSTKGFRYRRAIFVKGKFFLRNFREVIPFKWRYEDEFLIW